jgi:beta-phosphoglucomutase
MTTPIKALLFDMDGLLTDTETLHYESYRRVFEQRGIVMTEEFYADHWIRRGLKIADVCKVLDITEDPNNIRNDKMKVFVKLVESELALMEGAQEALDRLREHYSMALVTSSYSDAASAVLDAIHVRSHFQVIVTASDVANLKPDPEPWLLASNRLQIEPRHCLVIEDAEKGILAAHRAGMRSVAIPCRHTQTNDFSLATARLTSLNELTLDLIAQLQ